MTLYNSRMNIIALVISIVIPLFVGGLSAALSARGMAVYGNMNKPPLSPPAWLFPVAWTALYIMMGMASFFAFISKGDSKLKMIALVLYGIQLAMNFMWSIIFFNWNSYLVAFVWLMIMLGIVVFCAIRFYGLFSVAGYLMIPYIIWLSFAAYLNIGAYVLN